MGINQSLNFTRSAAVQEIQITVIDDNETQVLDRYFLVQIRSNGEVIDTANVTITEDDGELIVMAFSST